MATDSIREQLLAAIETRLKGIVKGATYHYTPGEVLRDWKNYDEVTGFPFYGIIEVEEDSEAFTYTNLQAQLRVTIVGWVNGDKMEQGKRRLALNRAIADVRRAVMSEESWGGLALVTRIPRTTTDEATWTARPFAYFEMTVEIDFVHARTAA